MRKILLVEDNHTVLEEMAFDLEMRGYEVMQASNGTEALDVLDRYNYHPDIIVSDIAMPDMDGYKFLETVQGDERWNTVPFIFISAFTSPNAIRLGKELGVDDYITKPFQPDDLVLAMENKFKRIDLFRKNASLHLNDMRQNLVELIAHELRTPLTSVYGGIQMLADHISELSPDSINQMVNIIHSGAARLTRLVDQITLLNQFDSRHFQSRFDQESDLHDAATIITYACNAIKYRLDVGHRLNVRLRVEPLYIKGIPELLRMALEELVRNALLYSPASEEITIELHKDPSNVIIQVKNRGIGIAPEDQSRVWERFTQINRMEHEQQGAGLGLALVYETVKLHGGSCQITSDEGITTVSIFLPR